MIRWDFGILNSDGQLILVVQVKNKPNVSHQWAVQYRQNLLHGKYLSNRVYFLLVMPDRLCLWEPGTEPDAPPTFMTDSRQILQAYYERSQTEPEQIGRQSFEMLVTAWLNDLLYGLRDESSSNWLIETGLDEVIKNGHLVQEVSQ